MNYSFLFRLQNLISQKFICPCKFCGKTANAFYRLHCTFDYQTNKKTHEEVGMCSRNLRCGDGGVRL
jgi:hypothetical protein